MSYFNIAVDGPAGAGKSTIAKAVAAKLGFIYVDTGAMYRAMALYFLATSVYLPVREKLVQLQQELAKTANVIMDGRDIGTCVLPDAQAKVYLTASSAIRAKRRYDELKEKGVMCNLEEIEQDIIERDYRDMHREHSPLKQAEDAVLVDSSDMTIEEVIDAIIEIARRKGLDA